MLELDEREDERGIGNEIELDEGIESRYGWRSLGDLGLDSGDFSGVDPVKEFGFLVMGQEFNHYPKQMIRQKTWNWFLEEPDKDNDNDEVYDEKGFKRKRKKDEGNYDEEWTGESEEDKEQLTKVRKVQNPKYSTRSKDRDKPTKDTGINKHSVKKSMVDTNEEEEEEEEEEDDTLGGFIVENDDMDEEEMDEGEEEDFNEDDEED